MNTHIREKLFQEIPRRVAQFGENRPRYEEKSVDGKNYIKLECWQLTCQFPTGQSPAWSSSDRRNYDTRESDQQTQGLTENNRHLYESIMSLSPVRFHLQLMWSQNWWPWQRPFDPRSRLCLHWIACPRKPTPRIKQRVASCHTTEVIAHRKPKSGCHGNVP